MLLDLGDTAQKFINSPPGQLTAGVVLAGIVWKFFERVEAVLNNETKLEIAVWLLGVRVGQKLDHWPGTFAKIFDRVFGSDHFSWKCFGRSVLASLSASLITIGIDSQVRRSIYSSFMASALMNHWANILSVTVLASIIPDYLSLLKTRYLIRKMSQRPSWWNILGILLIDGILSFYVARWTLAVGIEVFYENALHWSDTKYEFHWLTTSLALSKFSVPELQMNIAPIWFYPAFFTSIWLWSYAASGFAIKGARRFDIGFSWFTRHFNIEEKPLSAIGLVAGGIVAVCYWALAVGVHLIGK